MATLPSTHRPDLAAAVGRRAVQVVLGTLLYLLLLFVGADRASWGWGWAFAAVVIVQEVASAVLLPADLIAERGRMGAVERWDRTILALATIPYMALPFVAGLDVRLGGSPPLPAWAQVAALVVFALAQAWFTWAMVHNRFFSTAVRLQPERGHVVETGGPYRYVRHPGYAGTMVGAFATAVALGSLYALVPAVVLVALFVARTVLEDRKLRRDLDGYEAYARRVRYRLLPGVW